MKPIRCFFFILILIMLGCNTYIIDKESAAIQMTNLKVERRAHTMIETPSGSGSGSGYYSNLKYLIIKKDSLSYDTIVPFDSKFFLKSGINSGWGGLNATIFKDGYFISFYDTTLKANPKCKFCKIHFDSIQKILIRGRRMNKIKNTK